MNQNKYRMEIDSIKASERLKSRIIQEVETKERGEDKVEIFVRRFAGTVAVAGIAVVMYLAYKGGMENDEGKLRPASGTKEEVTLESTTEADVVYSEHDMSLTENTNLVSYINGDVENIAWEDKLKYTVKNDGEDTQVIMPEFWVMEVVEDYKKGFCMEELKPDNDYSSDYGERSEIIIKPDETATIDVTDELMQKYPSLLKEEKQAYIVFYTRGVEDNKPTGIFMLQTGLNMQLYPDITNPYLEKGDNEIQVSFGGFRKDNFSGHASCTLVRWNETIFDYETLGGINWESDIICDKVDEDEGWICSDDMTITIPSTLEAGGYYLQFKIEDDATGFSAERREQFFILNDKYDSQIMLNMDKSEYSVDEIDNMSFNIDVTDGTTWRNIEYELFKVNAEDDFERINAAGYYDVECSGEEDFELKLSDEALYITDEKIEPGKYMLVVTADDGNTKQVGVGEVKTNVVRVKTEFDIVK